MRRLILFANRLPDANFSGSLTDYIFKYLTPFRIHHWVVRDLDKDGKEEALLLMRTDDDLWGGPNTGLASYAKRTDGYNCKSLVRSSQSGGRGTGQWGLSCRYSGRPGIRRLSFSTASMT